MWGSLFSVFANKWLLVIDKDCKLMEAGNFNKIPKLTLKVPLIIIGCSIVLLIL